MNTKQNFLIMAFLIAASFVAFGRIASNDFITFDDDNYITANTHIKSGIHAESIAWAFTSSHASNWHPLTWISHMLDWQVFGANASGHHLASLLLHIGSALLLFLFLDVTTGAVWPSALAAALFTLHPLRVESVAWAAERKDVLSVFLGMAVLSTYAFYVRKPRPVQYFLCLILFALSLLAKPMLVTLPFALVLLDYWPLSRFEKAWKPQLLWEKTPFIFLALGSCMATIWAQNRGGTVASLEKLQFSERILNAVVSYVAYLSKIFWPVHLAAFYPYEPSLPLPLVVGAAALLLGVSIAALSAIKKAPFLFVGWFWYLGTLVPVIGLIQVGRQAMADRYTYLPSIGVGIMVSWGAAYLLPKEAHTRKALLVPTASVLLAVLTILSFQQCGYWKNSMAFYRHVLAVTENNDLAHYNLANDLAKQGSYEEAIAHYREAVRINPSHYYARLNFGVALAALNKEEEAVTHYRAAITINPEKEDAHYNLGIVSAAQGRNEEAIAHYRAAIRLNPRHDAAYNNLANLFARQGRTEEAMDHYRQAIKANPGHFNAHFRLASLLAKERRREEAIEHFRQAISLRPDDENAKRALRLALETEKRQER